MKRLTCRITITEGEMTKSCVNNCYDTCDIHVL